MSLKSLFQISVYTVTALSGAMLAYGEGVAFPSALTVVLAICAYFISERHAVIRIGPFWSNVLGLAALGLAVFEFFGHNLESRLLAGAHFLVYLTWIVLFQDKHFRQYWWLLALGLLQVAVGSVLTDSGWYGVFLVVYLLLALWTMSVFNLYNGAQRFGALEAPGIMAAGRLSAPAALAPAGAIAPVPALTALFRTELRSETMDAVQQDVPGRWISPRFVCGVVGISLAGLVLGLALFLLVPRYWFGSGNPLARSAAAGLSARTGFTEEVRLGHLGRILESNERVMQVRLFDRRDRDQESPLGLDEFAALYGLSEPLFRGSVLDTYETGRWSRTRRRGPPTIETLDSYPIPRDVIRQEYQLNTRESEVLFAMRPILIGRMDPYEPMLIDRATGTLSTHSDFRDSLKYFVYSPRPAPGQQVTPRQPFGDLQVPEDSQWIAASKYARPPEDLDRLCAHARQIARYDSGAGSGDEPTALQRARLLEAWLRDSGQFTYSLNMTVVDPEIDPVEDFLFNRKSGHCEYFASALALMLRAVGVPSRLVTGFKGAEQFTTGSGSYYEVAQRHAHAWVEACLDGDWVVLDPTPAARDESVRSPVRGPGVWSTARNQMSSLWSDYVLSMSSSRQRESFYDPFLGSFAGGARAVRDKFAQARQAAEWARARIESPDQWFVGAAILAGLAVIALATFSARRLRRKWLRNRARATGGVRPRWVRWLPAWLARWWVSGEASQFVVEFYQRFVALAAKRGVRPTSTETAREFARHVEQALYEPLRRAQLATFPTELTELYYRVRFGGQSLEQVDASRIEPQLQLFEEHLHQRSPPRA